MKLEDLKKELLENADAEKATQLRRFFKTGKGDYGEGDKFIGVTLPVIRKIAKKYKDLSVDDIDGLVKAEIHEIRMTALIIMTLRYEKEKETFFSLYTKNIKFINNWDLVDVTCPRIIGNYLFDKPRDLLFEYANSNDLWKKRIAVISTFYFIKQYDFKDSLRLAEILIDDGHDLIQKAVGWMLREVGNKSRETEEGFLKKHYKTMPRATLRYAIEKFPEPLRIQYLRGDSLL